MPSNDFLTQSLSRGSGILPAIQKGFNVQKKKAAAQQVLNAKTQAAGLKRGAFLLDVQKEGRLNKQALFDQNQARVRATGEQTDRVFKLFESGAIDGAGVETALNSNPEILKSFGVNNVKFMGNAGKSAVFQTPDGSITELDPVGGASLRIIDVNAKKDLHKNVKTFQSLSEGSSDKVARLMGLLVRSQTGVATANMFAPVIAGGGLNPSDDPNSEETQEMLKDEIAKAVEADKEIQDKFRQISVRFTNSLGLKDNKKDNLPVFKEEN